MILKVLSQVRLSKSKTERFISGAINVSAADETNLPIGYWNIAEPYRYVIFASDGGSYIRPIEKTIGTTVNLYEYVPTKEGYIFDGWYSDPRPKEQQVTEVTLNENIVVFAKWIDDGTPKAAPEVPVIASTEEILAYGNYIDEATGVPVTALWVQQNARLNELMQIYNQNFNK